MLCGQLYPNELDKRSLLFENDIGFMRAYCIYISIARIKLKNINANVLHFAYFSLYFTYHETKCFNCVSILF